MIGAGIPVPPSHRSPEVLHYGFGITATFSSVSYYKVQKRIGHAQLPMTAIYANP